MIQARHRGRVVGVGEQDAARAGRAGVVDVVEFQQREVLPHRPAEEPQVARLEIALDDLLRARAHALRHASPAELEWERVASHRLLQRSQIRGVVFAVEEPDHTAAVKNKVRHELACRIGQATRAREENLLHRREFGARHARRRDLLGEQRTGEIVIRIQRRLEEKRGVLFRIGRVRDDEDAFLFHDRNGEKMAVVEREIVRREADLALVQARPASRHGQRDFGRAPRRDGDLLFKTRAPI